MKTKWINVLFFLGLCMESSQAFEESKEVSATGSAAMPAAAVGIIPVEDLPEKPGELIGYLQHPDNRDLLEFIKIFSVELCKVNAERICHGGIPTSGTTEKFITQGDRRLDAMARLLEGDEICASVVFDEAKNTLRVSTNEDDHFRGRFECPLWDRICTLDAHLRMIARLSKEAGISITKHEWLATTRGDFLGEALPYLLLSRDDQFKKISIAELRELRRLTSQIRRLEEAISELKKDPISNRGEIQRLKQEIRSLEKIPHVVKLKNEEQKFQELREFAWRLNKDFCEFEQRDTGEDDDIIGRWVDYLETKVASLMPPSTVTKKYEKRFKPVVTKLFQDLLKVENFFATQDERGNPHAASLVSALADRKLQWRMEDEGGPGVHAEIRHTARAIKEDVAYAYMGISKLCCPHCNLVIEKVLKLRYFERDDAVDVPTRGQHAAIYPWPIHNAFKSPKFLKAFLGDDLYARYEHLKALGKENPVLSLIHLFPLLGFEIDFKTKATSLGIEFPAGERELLRPDSSIDYSKVPTTQSRRKAFFLLNERKLVTDDSPEFEALQLQKKGARRAFAVDIPDDVGDLGLWYTDEQVREILRNQLPETDHFSVIDPAAGIFDNVALLQDAVRNALTAALAGQVAIMPIHLHGNHWVGAVLRAYRDEEGNITQIQVIYNNPQGYVIDIEDNAVAFIGTIQAVAAEIAPGIHPDIIDLRLRQQHNGIDCGPFNVDNLIRLAKADDLKGVKTREEVLSKVDLAQSEDGNAHEIRASHNVILTRLGIPLPAPEENFDAEEDEEDAIAYGGKAATGGFGSVARTLSHPMMRVTADPHQDLIDAFIPRMFEAPITRSIAGIYQSLLTYTDTRLLNEFHAKLIERKIVPSGMRPGILILNYYL